jgi:hypothetical protein
VRPASKQPIRQRSDNGELLTQIQGTSDLGHRRGRVLGWLAVTAGVLSVPAVVVLALTGHSEQATAVGIIGDAMATVGGIQVTVNIRR